jgi:protein TonB
MNARRSLVLVLAVLISAPLAAQQTPAQKAAEDAEFLKGTYQAGVAGVTHPVVVKEEKPRYTSEAMREKLQGSVEIQAIVGVDGKVDRARIIHSLDKVLGLDAAALTAVKGWLFRPGTKDGQAVPVAVTLNLEFRLH